MASGRTKSRSPVDVSFRHAQSVRIDTGMSQSPANRNRTSEPSPDTDQFHLVKAHVRAQSLRRRIHGPMPPRTAPRCIGPPTPAPHARALASASGRVRKNSSPSATASASSRGHTHPSRSVLDHLRQVSARRHDRRHPGQFRFEHHEAEPLAELGPARTAVDARAAQQRRHVFAVAQQVHRAGEVLAGAPDRARRRDGRDTPALPIRRCPRRRRASRRRRGRAAGAIASTSRSRPLPG